MTRGSTRVRAGARRGAGAPLPGRGEGPRCASARGASVPGPLAGAAEPDEYNPASVVTKPADAGPTSGDGGQPTPPSFAGDIRSVRLVPTLGQLRTNAR